MATINQTAERWACSPYHVRELVLRDAKLRKAGEPALIVGKDKEGKPAFVQLRTDVPVPFYDIPNNAPRPKLKPGWPTGRPRKPLQGKRKLLTRTQKALRNLKRERTSAKSGKKV